MFADIYVSSDSPYTAKAMALTYLSEWGWRTAGAVDARLVPEPQPEWEQSAVEAYHDVVHSGIHAIMKAVPLEDHPDWPAMLAPPC